MHDGLSRTGGRDTSRLLKARAIAIFCASLLVLLAGAAARGAEPESRFASFDGVRVHYRASGQGEEALVFVHGWTCNADFWRAQTGVRQFYRLYPQKTLGLVIVDGGLRLMGTKEQMEKFTGQMRASYATTAPQMIDGMLAPVKDEALKREIRTAMLATPDYVAISAELNGALQAFLAKNKLLGK
jgi:hypothetical protein